MAPEHESLFRRFVALGDSVSQGAMHVGVSERSQPWGVPALIARQAGAEFRLPLLAAPGFPSQVNAPGEALAWRLRDPGRLAGRRLRPEDEVDNFAVAGARLRDVVGLSCANAATQSPTWNVARLTRLTLNPTGRGDRESLSQLDCAVAARPSAVWLWAGANDVIQPLFSRSDGFTPPSLFAAWWKVALERLLAETEAVLITPTVPDIRRAPLLRGWMRRHPALLREIGRHLAAFDHTIRSWDGLRGRVVVLDPGPELAARWDGGLPVRDWRLPFWPPADGRLRFERLRGLGRGVWQGGLTSYDGLHPTQTGYAVWANVMLAILNRKLGMEIPLFDLPAVAAADPDLRRASPLIWWLLHGYTDRSWGDCVARLAAGLGERA